MVSHLDRRSFTLAMAGLVPAYRLLPFYRWIDDFGEGSTAPGELKSTVDGKWACPPCGLDCDKLVFDKPGSCPQCGMTLIPLGSSTDGPPVVAVLLFNGAEIIDFAGPWEAFGTAGFLVHTVAETMEPHTMVFGQKVMPDYTFDNSPKANVLLVPGGGVGKTANNPNAIRWIQTKSNEVSQVMSVCTGAFLLAKAGLLDGLPATVTYGMEEELAKAGKNIKVLYPQRFVDAGKIITTAGLSSGIDGALHLISKMAGNGNAQSVALEMEYQWHPDGNFARAGLADRYLPDGLQFGKPHLRGGQATLISTDGDTDHWEIKILVSDPATTAAITELVSTRIKENTTHTQGPVTVSTSATTPQIKWTFKDDQGSPWRGTGSVEPSLDAKDKFIATLKLARDKR